MISGVEERAIANIDQGHIPTPNENLANNARILFILSSMSAGGAERVASSMLNFWANQSREIGLLTLAKEDNDHYPLDTRITRFSSDLLSPSKNIWQGITANVRRMQSIRAAVEEFKPDIVISFIERTNILTIGALLGKKLPVIVSERIDPRQYHIDVLRRLARRCVYPRAKSLVMQTQSVADWGRSVMVNAERVAVIANPVPELPTSSTFSSRGKSLLAVGRLTHQKGFDLLIQAFAVSRVRANGWTLNILGDGPDREILEGLIEQLDVADQVRLVGVVSDPWAWMDRARIFLLPSRFEGFPNVLLEAMSMGCACIAADCPSGPSEIINNEQNGLLVAPSDVTDLVNALDHLEENQELAEQFANSALQVREEFAVERIMYEWDTLIGKCLSS